MTLLKCGLLFATAILAPAILMAESTSDNTVREEATLHEHDPLMLWRSKDIDDPFLAYLINYVDEDRTEARFMTCLCVEKVLKVDDMRRAHGVCPNGPHGPISLDEIWDGNSTVPGIVSHLDGKEAQITDFRAYQSDAETLAGVWATVGHGVNKGKEVWIPEPDVGFAAVLEHGANVPELFVWTKDLSTYQLKRPNDVEEASVEALRAHKVLECKF